MKDGLNAAERFVYDMCKRSFLRLWSYVNPQGKDPGKELCDVVVVCPPDVIIFSVKDIAYKDSGRIETDVARWLKRAVDESVHQLYGAERQIRLSTHVIQADGSEGIELPRPPDLRVHRIAVAVGSRGKVPLPFGDFGKGFVHVLDEVSAQILFRELDSLTDFVEYLLAKEAFCRGVKELIQVREEDFLAIFLQGGRRFPESTPDVIIAPDELWDAFIQGPELAEKKNADQVSYVWDRLIDVFAKDVLGDNLQPHASPSDAEKALRLMARECRFSRRILGEAFKEFVAESAIHPLARMLTAPSGVVYVFLALPRDHDRSLRQKELQLRCFVARGLNKSTTTVVGIGTEQYSSEGYSLDIAIHHQTEWLADQDEIVMQIQADLGYFVHPRASRHSYDEYPITTPQENTEPEESAK